jgi:hypothetical protein
MRNGWASLIWAEAETLRPSEHGADDKFDPGEMELLLSCLWNVTRNSLLSSAAMTFVAPIVPWSFR